jgi:glycine oxidase
VRSPDVVVVGAGVIGCAVAWELSRRGASVRVIDRRPPGMGATQASAGVLAPYIEAREGGPLLDLTERGLLSYDTFVARLRADASTTFEYERSGTLDVALRPDAWQRLAQARDIVAARGARAELLDSRAVRESEPHLSAEVAGGLLIPAHGFVGVTDMIAALVEAAARHGATFSTASVRRVSSSGSDATVITSAGAISAGIVVLAAGSWSGQVDLEPLSPPPVRPVRGQLVRLTWNGPPIHRVVWGERCYLVPWHDGTLLVGATVEDAGFDERITAAAVHDLIEAACELVPHAWTATFAGARVGLRPASPDHLPLVGPSETMPNLIYATGHYRNGVLLAPLTAALIGDLIIDDVRNPLLTLTSPSRAGILQWQT